MTITACIDYSIRDIISFAESLSAKFNHWEHQKNCALSLRLIQSSELCKLHSNTREIIRERKLTSAIAGSGRTWGIKAGSYQWSRDQDAHVGSKRRQRRNSNLIITLMETTLSSSKKVSVADDWRSGGGNPANTYSTSNLTKKNVYNGGGGIGGSGGILTYE